MSRITLLTMILLTSTISTNANAALAESSLSAGATAKTEEGRKTAEERLNELEQKVKIVERQLEIEQEKEAEKAKTAAVVTATAKEGFSIKSPEGDFWLKIKGYLQADSRSISGTTSDNDDTFLLRRVRPVFEGAVGKNTDFRIMPDFGGGKTELQDAWLDLKYVPQVHLQVGKFKTPFGIERLQSGTDTLFVERGLPNNLVPNRDIGAAFHADLLDGRLSYAAGVFNGVADGASLDSDIDNNKEFAGRVFLSPWKGSGNWSLDGLGAGFAVTAGNENGTGSSTSYLPTFKTPGQATFFSYRSDAVADGQHTRYSPQTYYSYGSFGLLGEYVVSQQQVSRGASSEKIVNDAWQVLASYVLTGEPASYKSVVPKNPFDVQKGTWGAFEVVGRVGQLNADDDAFPTFAATASSAKSAKSWGIGLNWIWSRNVKWMIDYDQTRFDGGDSAGDREKEHAILVRSQISF